MKWKIIISRKPKRRIEKMLFEDMKKFYMAIGFLNEFANRGFSVGYPEDYFYVTNHLEYLLGLANKYNVVYEFDDYMSAEDKVEVLESELDYFFTNYH